jgi:hypothetical protein
MTKRQRLDRHAAFMRANAKRAPHKPPPPPPPCDCGVCAGCAHGNESNAMLRARRRLASLRAGIPEGKYDELYRDLRRMIPRDSCAALCEQASLYSLDVMDRDTRRRIDAAYRSFLSVSEIRLARNPYNAP